MAKLKLETLTATIAKKNAQWTPRQNPHASFSDA